MQVLNIVLAIILVILAIALIIFVLFQNGGRSNKLSQAISGGSPDNFTGKNKQRSKDKKYARITTILAIVFAIVVIVFAMLMSYQSNHPASADTTAEQTTESDTEATDTVATDAAETTQAEEAVTTEAETTVNE